MALETLTGETTVDPDTEDDDDDTDADGGDAGTPAEHEDEDLQTPPINADELPAH
jgi:hypothetical protein